MKINWYAKCKFSIKIHLTHFVKFVNKVHFSIFMHFLYLLYRKFNLFTESLNKIYRHKIENCNSTVKYLKKEYSFICKSIFNNFLVKDNLQSFQLFVYWISFLVYLQFDYHKFSIHKFCFLLTFCLSFVLYVNSQTK